MSRPPITKQEDVDMTRCYELSCQKGPPAYTCIWPYKAAYEQGLTLPWCQSCGDILIDSAVLPELVMVSISMLNRDDFWEEFNS